MTKSSIHQLGDMMSNISHRCHQVYWHPGSENTIPQMCVRAVETCEPQPWGISHISTGEARKLMALSNKIGGSWVNRSPLGYQPYDPVMEGAQCQQRA